MKKYLRAIASVLLATATLGLFAAPAVAAPDADTIRINSAKVFSGWSSDGGWLVAIDYTLTLDAYVYPTGDVTSQFALRLLDTDNTTLIASVPVEAWGDKPGSIYLGSSLINSLTYGSGYYVHLTSVNGSDVASYQLQPDDWRGGNLRLFDSWAIGVANRMNTEYGWGETAYDMLTTSDTGGQILSQWGGAYFIAGISAVMSVRPSLFMVYETEAEFEHPTSPNTYDSRYVWSGRVGSTIATDAATFGSLIDLGGQDFLVALLIFIVVCVAIYCAMKGAADLALIILCFPFLLAWTELRIISIQIVMLLTFGALVLFGGTWLLRRFAL